MSLSQQVVLDAVHAKAQAVHPIAQGAPSDDCGVEYSAKTVVQVVAIKPRIPILSRVETLGIAGQDHE